MGFDPISLASAGLGLGADALGVSAADQAADAQKKAQQQAVTDAANLVAQQKADQQNTLSLSTAFNSLATMRAGNSGFNSTQFAPKLGGA